MICITCNHPMSPGGDRPPSMGNPSMCVPCLTETNDLFGGKRDTARDTNPGGANEVAPNGRWTATAGQTVASRGACHGTNLPVREEPVTAGSRPERQGRCPDPAANLPLGRESGAPVARERNEAAYSAPGGNQFPADGTAAYGSKDGASIRPDVGLEVGRTCAGIPAHGPAADQTCSGASDASDPARFQKPKQTIIGPPPFIDERWGNRE